MIEVDAFPGEPIRHAFYTRQGGVSGGLYQSLNCGFGSSDRASDVAANRARAMAAMDLPADALFTCHQIHSREVATLDRHPGDTAIKADAMVTRAHGLALGVLTADCAPVLFVDAAARVIGAAHAGWRGALAGIAEATIDAMIDLGARGDQIHAAIGPCIGPASYEVGPEFPGPFIAQAEANAAFFTPAARAGHFMFDLGGYLKARLEARDLAAVHRVNHDTCANPDQFFSYRRSVIHGEGDYGRALSVIALAPV